MPDFNIPHLLENRHTIELIWHEPWQACGPEGNKLDAAVTSRATVHDCINMARWYAHAVGKPTSGPDREFLLDFAAVNHAYVYEP